MLPEVINPATGLPETPRYEYEYDYYGQQTLIRDPLGRETEFTYDQFGRQVSRTLPSVGGLPDLSETWEYDDFGRLYRHTDFENQVTEYLYNDLGQITTKNYYADDSSTPDDVYTYTYDSYGRRETIVELRGTTTYTYDDRGRLIEIDALEGTLEYEYDDLGRRTRTFSDNSDIRYAYDDFGQLETVTVIEQDNVVLGAPEVTTYSYNAVGMLVETELTNGTTSQYTYDELNRLTEIEHLDATEAVFASYEYDLASNGRRESVTETRLEADDSYSSVVIDYEYDALDRLVEEVYDSSLSGLDYEIQYIYDLNGNRLEKNTTYENDEYENTEYEYDARDRLLADLCQLWEDDSETTLIESESHIYTYDDNGALLSNVSSNGNSYTYTYNLQGRQATSTVERDENGTDVEVDTEYTYNDAGIRVKTVTTTTLDGGTPTVETRHHLTNPYNPTGYAQVLEERDGSGDAVVSYTIGHDVISQSDGTNVRFFLADAQGSTRLLIDSSEVITDRYNYDAYGNLLTVAYNTTNTPATRILYNGEQFDTATGQHYLRARYYSPQEGRFNRQDPFWGYISDPMSLHRYFYTNLNPVNNIDPTGMFTAVGSVSVSGINSSLNEMTGEVGQQTMEGLWFKRMDIAPLGVSFALAAVPIIGDTAGDAFRNIFKHLQVFRKVQLGTRKLKFLSGLTVVFRKNMPVQMFPGPRHTQIPVFGIAQKTGSKWHADAINKQVKKLAKSGKYDYITMNRSWRTSTGRVGTSGRQPDIIVVRRDGKVDAWEFQSKTDRVSDLQGRLDEGVNSLPNVRHGDTFIIPFGG